ncbi:hypothetical protein BpHYR1_034806, partial [Brachionus plicatilis]
KKNTFIKREDFFKQILYLSRKKNLSAKKIRGVLKKSYSKNSLPSIRYIKKLMGSSGKKVQKKNHRALASSIVDYIYARTLKLNGLESSKKLSKKIHKKFGKKISASYHLRLPSSYPKTIPLTSKFKSKLHIWAGISSKGSTKFAIFKQNMNSDLYRDILAEYLIPFAFENFDFDF